MKKFLFIFLVICFFLACSNKRVIYMGAYHSSFNREVPTDLFIELRQDTVFKRNNVALIEFDSLKYKVLNKQEKREINKILKDLDIDKVNRSNYIAELYHPFYYYDISMVLDNKEIDITVMGDSVPADLSDLLSWIEKLSLSKDYKTIKNKCSSFNHFRLGQWVNSQTDTIRMSGIDRFNFITELVRINPDLLKKDTANLYQNAADKIIVTYPLNYTDIQINEIRIDDNNRIFFCYENGMIYYLDKFNFLFDINSYRYN